MGVVVAFPEWQVIAREDGNTRGEPRVLVDPAGRRHQVIEVLRRRLVASPEPDTPVRHEVELRIGPGAFRVAWSEGRARWSVEPL